MSSTGIKENYIDYAIFYNDISCLSDINCSGLSVYNSLINGSSTSGTILGNLNSLSSYTYLNISSTNNNLNNLSSQSFFYTNYTNLNSLNVSGISKLNGAITCFNTLRISGNTIFNAASTCLNTLTVSGNTTLNNITTMNSSLTVSGNTTLNNITTLNSSLTVSGNTTLNNITTLNSTLTVSGNTILNNITTMNSTLTVSGNTILNNITTMNSTLTVSGNTIFNNVTTMNSTLTVSGLTTLNSASTCLNTLTISGATTFYNGIVGYGVNPAIMIGTNGYNGGGLGYVSNAGAFSSSAAAGDIVLRTNTNNNLVLQSGGNYAGLVINSSNNLIAYNNLNVSGITILSGALTCSSTLNAVGSTILSGALTCGSTLNAVGSIICPTFSLLGTNPNYAIGGGSLIGYCNTTGSILSTSAIIGDTVIRSATGSKLILQSGAGLGAFFIDSSNNIFLNNPITCGSSLNVAGTSLLINPTTCATTLNVSGASTFNNAATFLSTLNVSGSIASGASSYVYAGGLRLGGFDTGNTIYNGANNMGITVSNGYNITIGLFGGIGSIIQCNNAGTTIYNATTCASTLNVNGQLTLLKDYWHQSSDGIYRVYYQSNGTTYFHSGNTNGEGFKFRNTLQSVDLLTITNSGVVTAVSDINTSGYITASGTITGNHYKCTSTSVAYTASWSDQGTNGCFIPLNTWWANGYCNLNVCIYLLINGSWGYYWMGRASLNRVGGVIGFWTDCQSGGAQTINLSNVWDGFGNNAIRITNGDLSTYGGTCYYKFLG